MLFNVGEDQFCKMVACWLLNAEEVPINEGLFKLVLDELLRNLIIKWLILMEQEEVKLMTCIFRILGFFFGLIKGMP